MTAFLAWLWQGAALAVAIAALVRTMPRLNAATRHLLWWAGLAGILVLAVVHSGLLPAAAPVAVTGEAGVPVPVPAPFLTLPAVPPWLVGICVGAWAALAALGLGRLARSVRHVARLRHTAVPFDAARASRLSAWSGAHGRGRRARLCLTDLPLGACALGFLRPVILVSRHLAATLDDETLDQVVMHEQAHLDRFDDWLRVIQGVVTALAGLHPAVRLIGRQIDVEREAACDDRVVSVTGAPRRYASCLAEAAIATATRVPTAAPAALGDSRAPARSLHRRIARLLDPRPDRGRRISRPAALLVAALLIAASVAATRLPSFVTFAGSERDEAGLLAPVSPLAPAPEERAAARERLEPGSTTRRSSSRARPVASARANQRVAIETRGVTATVPVASPATRPSIEEAAPASLPGPVAPLVASTTVPVMLHTPAAGPAAGATSDRLTPAGATASWHTGMTRLARSSAFTARKMGHSLAGAFTRVGESVGSRF